MTLPLTILRLNSLFRVGSLIMMVKNNWLLIKKKNNLETYKLTNNKKIWKMYKHLKPS